MQHIRTLIVDDSPTMRGLIQNALSRDPRIEVVGHAGDPYEARQAIKALSPDVLTLDVEMPRMSGIDFLKKIMQLRPMPVVMVSTLTERGASTAIEALSIGAVDCVGKPANGRFELAFQDLAAKVIAAAGVPLDVLRRPTREAARPAEFAPNDKIVVIGASTGGVEALGAVLQSYPANCPPTVIVQHMPPGFTKSFADRLEQCCAPTVLEARGDEVIRAGHVYIASGGDAHFEIAGRASPYCRRVTGDPVSGHQPSVDVLFQSAAALGPRAVGVILTGMGKDGADGLLAMRRAGATTLGQNQQTSVVYGMPRVAAEIGAVEHSLPLGKIADHVLALCTNGGAHAR